MKLPVRTLVIILLATMLLAASSCATETALKQSDPTTSKAETSRAEAPILITPSELAEMILKDPSSCCLIDVRKEEDRQDDLIPGAAGADYETALNHPEQLNLPMDKTLVVYCYHGVRSARVANSMIEIGYSARSLQGGHGAWEKLLLEDDETAAGIDSLRQSYR
jgi:rhodanese-related sulfurtransferase